MSTQRSSKQWLELGFDALHAWVTQKREYLKEYSKRCLLKALEGDPTSVDAWYALGQFYHFAGNPDFSSRCEQVSESIKQSRSEHDGRAALTEIKIIDKIPKIIPTVEQFVIIWWDSVQRDAENVAELVPTLHPELVFSTPATHFVTPLQKLLEIAQPLIHHPLVTQVAAQVAVHAMTGASGARPANDAVADAIAAVTMNVATMQVVDEQLRSSFGFEFVKNPDRLICQQVRQINDGGGVYALVLDQDINPVEYWFNTTHRLESIYSFYAHTRDQTSAVPQTQSQPREKSKWWRFWK